MNLPTQRGVSPPPVRPGNSLSSIQETAKLRKAQQRFRSLVIYAKMLGIAWDVKVIFDPSCSTAWTNKKEIHLRPCTIGDEEDAVLMECLLDHEAGVHCRQTDFELLNRWAPTVPDFTKSLWNIFEDVWGERELYRFKPGCARSINAGLQILVNRGLYGPPSPGLHPAAALTNALLGGLRSSKLRQTALQTFHEKNWEIAQNYFGAGLSSRIWAVAQDVDRCFSTGDAISLAERIVGMLRDYMQMPPPPPPPPPSKSDDKQDKQDKPDIKPDAGEPQDPQGSGDSNDEPGQPEDSPEKSPGNPSDDDSPDPPEPGDSDKDNDSDDQGNGKGKASSPGYGDGQPSDSKEPGDSGSPSDAPPGKSSGKPSSTSKDDAQPNPGEADGQPGSGSPTQARSVTKDPGQKPGSSSNGPQPQPAPAPSPPTAPDQNPIQSDTQKDDPSSLGTAAPQPAPMTPEEFKDATNAVLRTLQATAAQAGTGELGDALSKALGDSMAPSQAQSLGITAGNSWELNSSTLAPNVGIDNFVSETARPISVRLGSKLDTLLEAQTTANVYLKRQGRRLSPGKLVSLVTTGNQRIFKASDDVEELDTVLHIVTDISSSMNAGFGVVGTVGSESRTVSRIGAAASCTRALGDVLDRFDVTFAVSYFGACLTKVKGYEDNWRKKKELYWTRLESSTCTDQALIGVIPELASRIEQRKLLGLITDGVPAHAQSAALALSEARKLGIDCFVVILTDSTAGRCDPGLQTFKSQLDRFGIASATAHAVEELAQAVFDAVKQAF